jgi:hypothetical protein
MRPGSFTSRFNLPEAGASSKLYQLNSVQAAGNLRSPMRLHGSAADPDTTELSTARSVLLLRNGIFRCEGISWS